MKFTAKTRGGTQWHPFRTSAIAGQTRWGGPTHAEPFAVYARNALINAPPGPIDTLNERYSSACSPWHDSISGIKRQNRHGRWNKGPTRVISREVHRKCTAATASMQVASPYIHNLELCPVPMVIRAIHLGQAYWSSMYHFLIEVFPRIFPFLDSIVLNDPSMRIHVGSSWPAFGSAQWNEMEGFKKYIARTFNEIAGVPVANLVGGRIFAREVIVPEGMYVTVSSCIRSFFCTTVRILTTLSPLQCSLSLVGYCRGL